MSLPFSITALPSFWPLGGYWLVALNSFAGHRVTPLADRGGKPALLPWTCRSSTTGHPAIPAVSGQATRVNYELKLAAAQRDHLRANVAAA